MKLESIVIGCILFAFSCGIATAQGASEASGTILDGEGNGVPGLAVTFRPQGNPSMVYTGKTNKKGKYYVSGLFTPKEDDMWDITVEGEGWVPINVRVESRTVNRVLVGDIMEAKLPFGGKVPEIMIRPMGKAKVDFTVVPENEAMEAARQKQLEDAQAKAVEAGADPDEVAAAAAPQRDPWAEALTLVNDGNLEDSVDLFVEAIEAKPEDAERHASYAKVLYGLERYDDAAAAARQALELNPERVDARQVLASALVESGDLEGAKVTLEQAIELAPEDVGLYERLAYVAGEAGDEAGAIAAYESIIEFDSYNVNAWMALGGLYSQNGDPAKSEMAYQKVADLDPADAYQTFYNLGALIMSRDDRTDADTLRAIDAFRKAIEIKPDYAQAYQQLAFALLGIGDRPGALKALEDFVRVAPNSPDADRMKGLIATLKKTA